MVEGQDFLVDVTESTTRGFWKSLERGGGGERHRLNMASRLNNERRERKRVREEGEGGGR